MKLSVLRYMVKTMSKQGKTDLNKRCESFYADILNIVYGYDLINVNDLQMNSAAIDLADEHTRLCVQVTATSASSKIKDTISKFIELKLYERYDQLHILILVDKLNHTTSFETGGHFVFDRAKHIYDVDDVLDDVEKLPLERLEKLGALVDLELAPVAETLAPASLLAQAEQIQGGPPASAYAFLSEFVDEEGGKTWRDNFSSLIDLREQLASLSSKQREVVAFMLEHGKEQPFRHRIGMPVQTLPQKLRMDEVEFRPYYDALSAAGVVDLDDDENPRVFELRWPLSHGYHDAFAALRVFLKDSKEIYRVIVECDFSLLD